MTFYSKTTGGFYDPAIHGDNVPADAVEITKAQHAALLAGQSAGQRIEPDEHGQPVLIDRPAATLAEVKDAKRAAINSAADAALTSITSQYPRSEIDSWQIQLSEANAYTADSNASTPFIDGLVARRTGVDKPTLVGRILANAAAWTAMSSDVFGQRQALDDLVDDAVTIDDVNAIAVDIQAPVV